MERFYSKPAPTWKRRVPSWNKSLEATKARRTDSSEVLVQRRYWQEP